MATPSGKQRTRAMRIPQGMFAKRRAQHRDRGSHHCLRPGSKNKPQKETTSVD